MIDHQFYPTPYALALKAKRLFQNQRFIRILEPSAGRGDLLAPWIKDRNRRCAIDCIECGTDNLAVLKTLSCKGVTVVGHDFLKYDSASMYSHIVMNPPFAQGAEHVLHAWQLLFDGEIVAIVNAETLRNPCSRQRALLSKLIEDHGSVEYLQEEFTTPETQRKTAVDVALIYLRKRSEFQTNFIDGLKAEADAQAQAEDAIVGAIGNEVTIPRNVIQNLVIEFDLAARAMKESAMYRARAARYVERFDRSIIDNSTQEYDPLGSVISFFNEGFEKLKQRAWSTILRSANVTEHLSSGQQKAVESQFEEISKLDFTVSNIYGFLDGIIAQQAELQIGMLCEVFDNISKYHPQNRVWFCGWKSNAKHRVNAYRILYTRFILPLCSSSFHNSFSWADEKRLQDFDKIFALLDGKHHDATYGLLKMTKDHFDRLRRGERVSCDYFDLRFYPGAQTLHFFPTRKDLIDRLNRMVGKHRQWLPMDEAAEETDFWEQYAKAETINRRMDLRNLHEWRLENGDDREKERNYALLREQFEKAIESMGIKYDLDSALPPSDGPVALPKLDEVA